MASDGSLPSPGKFGDPFNDPSKIVTDLNPVESWNPFKMSLTLTALRRIFTSTRCESVRESNQQVQLHSPDQAPTAPRLGQLPLGSNTQYGARVRERCTKADFDGAGGPRWWSLGNSVDAVSTKWDD